MGTVLLFIFLLYFGFIFLMIASVWKIYSKAGKPGWASIVPVYNIIVLLEIVGKPLWWIVLLFIPIVNVVILFIVYIELAKSFGKSAGYGVGLILLMPIFMPMLGFGDSVYLGPSGNQL